MAYIDVQESGGRTRAIAGVALIHAALGYALVVGLATSFAAGEEDEGFVGIFTPSPTPTVEPLPPPPPQPQPLRQSRPKASSPFPLRE